MSFQTLRAIYVIVHLKSITAKRRNQTKNRIHKTPYIITMNMELTN